MFDFRLRTIKPIDVTDNFKTLEIVHHKLMEILKRLRYLQGMDIEPRVIFVTSELYQAIKMHHSGLTYLLCCNDIVKLFGFPLQVYYGANNYDFYIGV